MKNVDCWDITPCGSCKNRRFCGTQRLNHQHIVFLLSVRLLLVTANVFPSSMILVTLMMETLRSSEMSVLTRIIQLNIPEDGIFHDFTSVSNVAQQSARDSFRT
jgi:hypothetical protein